MKAPFLRAPGNYDPDEASDQAGLAIDQAESKTQQQFKEECDINTIVERFGLGYDLPETVGLPVTGDFTQVVDFKTAQDIVTAAQTAFNELPGALRARFANSPQRLYEFMNDSSNLAEARELGLVNPAPPEPPAPPAPPPPSVKTET